MNDILNTAITQILQFIDLVYLGVLIVMCYAFKNIVYGMIHYFIPIAQSKKWAVLFIGIMCGIHFWISGSEWIKIWVTFAIGTSLYDHIINYIEKFFSHE